MNELSPWRKKGRLIRAYVRGLPVWCSWQVTYVCNFRCGFCGYWKEEVNYSEEARGREATLDDFRVGAAKLGEIGSLMISLAGGEPFMRRDLAEIVSILAEQHFPMVTTNGWLVTEQRARELWQAGMWGISVSLDYNAPERHDRSRGMSGAAERARRALEILSATRTRRWQRVNLLCVLNRENMGDLESLIPLAAQHNCSFMVQPYASIKTGNTELVPSSKAVPHLLRLKKLYSNFVSHTHFLEKFDRFYGERGIAGCKAGRAFFNIDNFLNVEKCVEFREEPVGNLRDLSGREMVRRLAAEHKHNHCRACWYNCRGEIESLYSATGLLRVLPALLWPRRFGVVRERGELRSGL